MEKIIIENRTEVSMITILSYIEQIVQMGRISHNDQYCGVTTWKNGIAIFADKNKCSDRFLVIFDEKMKAYYEENKNVR
jgi:predicted DNA-binding WGR domain protein